MSVSSSPSISAHYNVGIASAIVGFHLVMLWIFPLWLLPMSIDWAIIIPLFIWVHNTHWGLIHEAVHRLFSPSPTKNEMAGRLLGILMGASFHVLRFGHLMHHQYNRLWESEIYKGEQITWKARLLYYGKLFGGLYITEVGITLLITLLPTVCIKWIIQKTLRQSFPPAADAAEQVLFRRNKLQQVRIDGAASLFLYAVAGYCYGSSWPWFLAFLYSRALAISFFDNIYHYATAPDNSEVAMDLAMPRFASALLLHGNYHETHHLQPHIPWRLLPQHQRGAFKKNILQGARQQFYGPLLTGN